MFTMNLGISEDRSELSIGLPKMSEPLKVSAVELDEVIRQLAWFRASMLPAHAPVDLTPDTLLSSMPAIRWQATEDTIAEQSRLHLLHPGFGWVWIPLDKAAFHTLTQRVLLFLRPRTRMQ
jgi:hypothetical protein